jgi:hypothetical protein
VCYGQQLQWLRVTVSHRLGRIFSHYTFPGPFSIELTGAVMRQGNFIQKMVNMNWTNPNHFANDVEPLRRAIARYHSFLDLMAARRGKTIVPTLVRPAFLPAMPH